MANRPDGINTHSRPIRASSTASISRSICSLMNPASLTPLPDGRYWARPAEAQLSRQMPKARDGDPRNHRADACESVQVTLNYIADLGQDARRQRACDKGQFRI